MRATFIVSGRFGVREYRDAILGSVPLPSHLYVALSERTLTVNILSTGTDSELKTRIRLAITRLDRGRTFIAWLHVPLDWLGCPNKTP